MARVIRADDAFWRPSNQLGVSNTDLATQLDAASLGARLWRLAPGQSSTRHRHVHEAELYVLISGTGRIRVGDELLTLEALSAVFVEPGELRQVFNDTPDEALWLVTGAPPEKLNPLELTAEQIAHMYPDGPLAQPPELGAGTPELFFDVGSPYAWLAVERFESVVGVRPILQPVLLGGIFAATGRSSWARTERREEGMRDVEARAAAAGLPPVVWPPGWPSNYLTAMRAVVWAGRLGARDALARAALAAAFTRGEDLSQLDAVRAVGESVGLDPDALERGVANPAVKAELRAATERAVRLGVIGVPTTRVGETLHWGDDQLEAVSESARLGSPGAEQ